MKIVKKILIALLVVLVIAQFFSPDKNTGDTKDLTAFLEETNPNEEVKAILKNTCFDCHSSNTVYPWYSKITPVNYWMAEHVEDGKKHLNFSKWSEYSVKRKDHKFEELIEEVEEKEMPLPSYTWSHTEADLSPEQIEAVVAWAKKVRMGYALQSIPQK
ncbi:heme-binding domain-containing protein [Mesoflavibacter zeaxanthinifaciens]|uniref:heme-binding domain-containing protein n=1 Tax=Mesoflavibacter zeaxanthinifaciens TaxID=393060 RepID=UPI0003FDC4C2|nr:heme-binding domain-containing protein [Mesoflavibacter zeaxanthinifaciens]